jgi:hypothetical protein
MWTGYWLFCTRICLTTRNLKEMERKCAVVNGFTAGDFPWQSSSEIESRCTEYATLPLAWRANHTLSIEFSTSLPPWSDNLLKTKRRLLYLKTQFVPRSNTIHRGYKSQPVFVIWGISRSLFSDKYKTHKCCVDRANSCWMLNLLVHHVTSRL